MTPEQLEELKTLEAELFEAVKIDCNPKNWNGYGKKPVDLDRAERGNRSFDLKNADKTMGIFARTVNIIATHTKPTMGNIKDEEALGSVIDEIKKEAVKRLDKLDLGESSSNVH